MTEVREPAPLWPEAPRYCPDRPLPGYRFMPGHNPHPNRDPQGHSYGHDEPEPLYMPPERWSDNQLYLYGIDLYNRAYFWESHEAWEILWKLARSNPPLCKGGLGGIYVESEFLQGLIQNSAAQLKRHLRQWPGMAHLGREATKRIQTVVTSDLPTDGSFMGLNVVQLLQDMKAHYESVWNKQGAEPPSQDVPPPVLRLMKSNAI